MHQAALDQEILKAVVCTVPYFSHIKTSMQLCF